MNESEIIGLIIMSMGTILGVGVTVVKPILQVVKSMTELNESIKTLAEKFGKFEVNNHEEHRKIWEHNDTQDERIQNHELRIKLMEERENG